LVIKTILNTNLNFSTKPDSEKALIPTFSLEKREKGFGEF